MNPVLPRAIPFAVFVAFLALDPMLGGLAHTLDLDARWWYAIRVALVAGVLGWFWRSYVELSSVRSLRPGEWLLSAGVGVTVFALWIQLDFAPLAFGGATGFDPRTQYGSIDWALAATRLLGAIVIVPVMEELFWRSFVLRWIANPDFLKVIPMESGGKALALSALLFGLEHHLWFAGLAAGVTYGWLYMATGKLWTSIAAHATTNTALGVWVLVTGSWRLW